MAVVHRALLTWFIALIFLILVVLRLDKRVRYQLVGMNKVRHLCFSWDFIWEVSIYKYELLGPKSWGILVEFLLKVFLIR